MASWSISVKMVGKLGDNACNDFVFNVQPDDYITSVNDQIEKSTGLKAEQQRLIYRGRIICGAENQFESSGNEPKFKDIVGLGDGQTIHLVPRLGPPIYRTKTPDDEANPLVASLASEGVDNDDLLEEILSMGHTAPGSMEPVRQGLLTIHTMLQRQVDPRKLHRQFYKGQWIDCLDTVDEWLGATIVEIIKPEDILPSALILESLQGNNEFRPSCPIIDPIVDAQDFQGCVRLLLEPSNDPPLDCEWGAYRQRKNNEGVQLLLIHYNGWSHEWDEWIRSDSSRIDLLANQAHYPNWSTTVSPTIPSHFRGSPPTHFQSDNDEIDRVVLLPELLQVFSSIQNEMNTITNRLSEHMSVEVQNAQRNLPWIHGMSVGVDAAINNNIDISATDDGLEQGQSRSSNVMCDGVGITLKEQVQYLAQLLDRLGRTLIDSGPHLAAYADTLTPHEIEFQHQPLLLDANRDYDGYDDEVSVLTNPQHMEPTFPNEIDLEPHIAFHETIKAYEDEVSEVTNPQYVKPISSHEIELIDFQETSKDYDDEVSEITNPQYMEPTFPNEIELIPQIAFYETSKVYDDEVSEVTNPQYMEPTLSHRIEMIPQIVLHEINTAYNVIHDEESEILNPNR